MAPTKALPRHLRQHQQTVTRGSGERQSQARREANNRNTAASRNNPIQFTYTSQPPAPNPQAPPFNNQPSVFAGPNTAPQDPLNRNAYFLPPRQEINNVHIPDSTGALIAQARRQVEQADAAEKAARLAGAEAEKARQQQRQAKAKGAAMSSGFNFGQPASSGSGSGALFGTSGANQNPQVPGSNAFGNTPASSGAPAAGTSTSAAGGTGSLFGGSTNQPTSGFKFGPSNTSTTQSVFGQQPTSTAGGNRPMFGANGAGTTGGLSFPSSKPTTPAPGSSQPTAQPSASSNIFANLGNTASPAVTPGAAGGGLFSGVSNTPASKPGFNFSQATPASTQSIFGGNTGATASAAPSGGAIFGSTTPQGNKTAQPSTTPAGNPPFNVFNTQANRPNENQQPPVSQPQQQGSLFGAKTTAPASTPAVPFKFANTASSQSSTTPQPGSAGMFGAPKDTAQAQQGSTSTANYFGGAVSQTPASSAAPAASAAPTSNLFGNLGQTQGAGAGSSGAQPSTTTGFKFSPAGGASSTATTQPAATSTVAPSASTFNTNAFNPGGQTSANTSQPAASSAASAWSFQSAGQTTSSGAGQPSTAAPAAGAGGAGGGGGNIFNTASAGAPPPGTSGGSGQAGTGIGTVAAPTQGLAFPATTTTAPFQPSTFGATSTAAPTAAPTTIAPTTAPTGAPPTTSTTGPAPPQQSRLAAKSMDEILTTWSTSLASHQKTFQQLATRVSSWDRMLVENSSKISSLYGRCFQAERDCSEVERQLGGVEHGQLELEALLERYEGEVERMMEQVGLGEGDAGGGGVGGVDGERERTYKTAESCSTRLTEMGHSLTDMIDEVNNASLTLNNSNIATSSQPKPDDPLADIVRVLNGHLGQLQSIDEGATALQGKVAAAQREANIRELDRLRSFTPAKPPTTARMDPRTVQAETTDSSTPQQQTAMTQTIPQGCALLDLAPELRNNIYEKVFTSESTDYEVDLLAATPPSKALLLTCRQVCAEASGLYKAAYQKYWAETHFTLDLPDMLLPPQPLPSAHDMARIRRLKLKTSLVALVYAPYADIGVRWTMNHLNSLTSNQKFVFERAGDGKWWCVEVDKRVVTDGEEEAQLYLQVYENESLFACDDNEGLLRPRMEERDARVPVTEREVGMLLGVEGVR